MYKIRVGRAYEFVCHVAIAHAGTLPDTACERLFKGVQSLGNFLIRKPVCGRKAGFLSQGLKRIAPAGSVRVHAHHGGRDKPLPPAVHKTAIVPQGVTLVALLQAALHAVFHHRVDKLFELVFLRIALMHAGKMQNDGNVFSADGPLFAYGPDSFQFGIAPRLGRGGRACIFHVAKSFCHQAFHFRGSNRANGHQNHAFRVVPFAVKGRQPF